MEQVRHRGGLGRADRPVGQLIRVPQHLTGSHSAEAQGLSPQELEVRKPFQLADRRGAPGGSSGMLRAYGSRRAAARLSLREAAGQSLLKLFGNLSSALSRRVG